MRSYVKEICRPKNKAGRLHRSSHLIRIHKIYNDAPIALAPVDPVLGVVQLARHADTARDEPRKAEHHRRDADGSRRGACRVVDDQQGERRKLKHQNEVRDHRKAKHQPVRSIGARPHPLKRGNGSRTFKYVQM